MLYNNNILIYENSFRLIFKTQIHIHIHILYFKSLPITTYYLTTIHIKYLYLYSKTYNMGLKLNLYLTSLSRGSPVYPSTQLFSILTLQKQLKICLFFQKSLKNGCNNLYFHYFTFNEGKKNLFSYQTSFSRRGLVHPFTPTFGNINLTETMTNLIVFYKFNQKWLQESLFSP